MKRDNTLDALRGLAILGMVLSGSLAFGDVLAGWMFHAQVPPPLHKFDPTRAGITWVDLVFPIFLFALGAAIPLSMQSTQSAVAALWHGLRRFGWLLFFALFTHHMKAWVLGDPADGFNNLVSMISFGLLCMLLLHRSAWWLKLAGLATCVALLTVLPFKDGTGFSWTRSDIILVVLANMALAGSVVWWFTRTNPMLRMALLPFIAAVLLAGKANGSWNHGLLTMSPAPWAYQFVYLKYLFIVLPGTVAGEWLRDAFKGHPTGECAANPGPNPNPGPGVTLWASALIVVNVVLLYQRELLLNLAITAGLAVLLLCSVREAQSLNSRLAQAGVYALLLGLALEALEGGIRKDSSTFSYYGVTTGLAFLSLIVLRFADAYGAGAKATRFLATQGRNPLLAYVAGSLVLLPLLRLSGLHAHWAALNWHWSVGVLKGLLFTGLVAVLTWWITKRGWIWKI